MKTFFKNLIGFAYIFLSLIILMVAMVYPFALAIDDSLPLWSCWIVYPLALIVMASQSQILEKLK